MPAITKIVDGVLTELTSEELRVYNETKAAYDAKAGERNIAEIRRQRDELLTATDWAALPDSPAMSDAMTAYRKALRDYPATYTADTSAAWPTLGE